MGLPSSESVRVRVWEPPFFSSPPAMPAGQAGAPGPVMSPLPSHETQPDSTPWLPTLSTVATLPDPGAVLVDRAEISELCGTGAEGHEEGEGSAHECQACLARSDRDAHDVTSMDVAAFTYWV